METISEYGIHVTIQNRMMFAYNKNVINIRSDSMSRYFIVSANNQVIKVINYDWYEGVNVDISKLLQLGFTDINVRYNPTTIVVAKDDGIQMDFTVDVVYGVLLPKDSISQIGVKKHNDLYTRNVRWFTKFPFTLSYFGLNGQSIHEVIIPNGIQETTSITRNGIYDINLSPTDNPQKRLYILDGDDNTSEFTEPFDYPFWKLGNRSTAIYLDPCTCEKGWYLRWIDRKGFWQQYLFSEGTTTTKTKRNANKKEYTTHSSGFAFTSNRPIDVENTEVVKCCATRLDAEQFEVASSIIGSPYIELYRGIGMDDEPIWEVVNIEDSNISHDDRKVLGDVEIQFSTTYKSQGL